MKFNRVLSFLPGTTTIALACSAVATAADVTWDGGGTDDLWGTGANWAGDVAPALGDNVHFAGTTRLSPNFNYTAYDNMARIYFDSGAGAFVLGGNAIKLQTNGANTPLIQNNSTSLQTIRFANIAFANSGTVDAAAGDITLNLGTGTGSIFLDSDSTLTLQAATGKTVLVDNIIANGTGSTGNMLAAGTGTVKLARANTYTGTTGVDSGTLELGNNTAMGTGIAYVGNGGTTFANTNASLLLNTSGLTVSNQIVTNKADTGSGLGTGTRRIGGNFTTGSSTFSGNIFLNGGGVLTAGSGGTVLFSGVIQNGTDTGNVSRALTVDASGGTVTLTGANSYTGTTGVDSGTLELGHNTAMGATIAYVGNGGTGFANTNASLLLNTSGLTVSNQIVTNKADTGSGLGTGTRRIGGNFTSGSSTFSGNIFLNGGGVLTAGSGGTVLFSGVIQNGTDTGNVSSALTVDASGGTVTLTGNNTYTGGTTINAGSTVLVGNGGATGKLGSGALVNNGTLTNTLVGGNITLGGTGSITSLTGSGSSSFSANSISFATVTGGAFLSNTTGNQSYVTNSNNGGLVFTNGASTYNFTATGGASITMKGDIGAGSAPSSGGAIVNLDTSTGNGTIELDISVGRSNQFWNIGSFNANAGTGTINWAGSYGAERGGRSSQTTPITLTGALNMTAAFQSQTLQTLTVNATGASTISGNLLGTIQLVKGGASTLTLSGTGNTYSGTTAIDSGTLALANNTALGTGAAYVGNGGTTFADTTASLLLNASGLTVSSQIVTNKADTGSGLGTGTRRIGGNFTSGSSTFSGNIFLNGGGVLTAGSGGTVLFSGVIQNGTDTGNVSSALTVDASGGTVTLTGNNTYTGATTVNTGRLILSGTSSGTSGTSIASGAFMELNHTSGSRDYRTSGSTNFTGAGTLVKTGGGNVFWGLGEVTFNLSSGALIDVREGTFIGAASANDVWTNNKADLNVEAGATFDGAEGSSLANGGIFVDALSGGGTIKIGYTTGGPYGNKITFGVDNGTGSFGGALANSTTDGNFVKTGTGTQTLTGTSTATGSMTINNGTLVLANTSGDTLANTMAVIVDGATAILSIAGNSDTVGAVTLKNGASITGTTGTLTGASYAMEAGSVSAILGGSGILTKTTAGTLVLSQSNTYSGKTTVNSGTLSIAADNNLGTAPGTAAVGHLVINGGATLAVTTGFTLNSNRGIAVGPASGTGAGTIDIAAGQSLAYGGIIANNGGTGSLNIIGAGSLTLTGANTYTGGTTINTGSTVLVGNGGATGKLGSGALVNNGTLTHNVTGTISLGGSSNVTGLTGSGSSSFSGAAIDFSSIAGGAFSAATTTSTGNQSYVTTANNGLKFGTSGTYNFTTTGGASITMTGDVGSYSGASTAVVNLDTSSGNGNIFLNTSFGRNNSAWNLAAFNANAGAGTISWTGDYGAARGGYSSQGPVNLTGAINISTTVSGHNTTFALNLNTAGSSLISGALAGTVMLTKTGASDLTISGSGNATGTTKVSVGKLIYSNAGTYGGTTTHTIDSGATLEFNTTSDRDLAATTFNGTGTLVKSGNSRLLWGGVATTFALGSGSKIDVQGGTFVASNSTAEVWTNNKSDLNIESGAVFDAAEAGTLSAGGVFVNKLTGTGTIKLGYTDAIVATYANKLTFGVDNGSASFGGVLADGPNFHGTYVKTGSGTQTLTNTSTSTGTMLVNNGTLALGHATNTLADTMSVIVDGSAAILSIAGNNDTVGAVTLKNNGSITGSGGTLTGASYAMEWGSVTAKLGGTGALTKTTANTVTLSAANTYTGATNVNAGTLVIGTGGSLANTAVTVGGASASGTPTLAGGGTIAGATTIAAAGGGVVGTHSVGVAGVNNGVGTQTFSNTLSYGTGSIFEWNLQAASVSDPGVVSNANTGTYDKVVASGLAGSVTGSGAVFNITLGGNGYTDAFWDTNKSWSDIFSGTGAPANLASIFSSITGSSITWNSGFNRGDVGTEGYFTMTGTTLSWTAIPEVSNLLVTGLLGAGLLRRRRKSA